jgi:hypothetical protein
MTVAQYQKVYEINNTTPDTIERMGWIICALYGKTYDQVNGMTSLGFMVYVSRIERALTATPKWWQPRWHFQTDATKITLGQFIECQHWLKNDSVQVLDLVAASILKVRGNHAEDVLRIQSAPFNQVLPAVTEFVDSMNKLVLSYKGLFEQEPEMDENDMPVVKESVHPFIDQYGWIFSATEVARHEGITLDAAMDLPVMQAFNAMAYLKSKAQYEKLKMS